MGKGANLVTDGSLNKSQKRKENQNKYYFAPYGYNRTPTSCFLCRGKKRKVRERGEEEYGDNNG